MEEKEKNFNFKSRKESDVLKYIEMAQEQQKELFKFVKKWCMPQREIIKMTINSYHIFS